MRGYVALSWIEGDVAASRAAEDVLRSALDQGYESRASGPNWWVASKGPRAPGCFSPKPQILVVGEVFLHPENSRGAVEGSSEAEFAAAYARNRWGRYVVLFLGEDGAIRSVFRDPSGALPAHAWCARGLQVVASDTPDWLAVAVRPPVDLDWDRVRQLVEAPFELGAPWPLKGLQSVAPGELRVLGSSSEQVWSAEAIAASDPLSAADSRRMLRQRLDVCVGALAGRRETGIEISGGLDSAIVAAAAAEVRVPVKLALNLRAGETETDERRFARHVAERWGLPLQERRRRDRAWTAEAFEATAGDPLPSQNGRDLANDAAVAQACREAGVEVLLTGKGGDALFFQAHTPFAFADLWWDRPLRAPFSRQLPGVARWTRTSTWSLLRTAIRSRLEGRCDGDLPPGKRLHLAALQSGIAYYSACRRGDVVDLAHPLMAQPLVEWALRTPIPTLVPAGRERGLAREVFTDRLPASVASRRGKGDYAGCFNRLAARNLPFLRDYLLGGRLAAEGVIDRGAMELRLQPETLCWRGGAAEILAAVSVEAWVRRWEARRQGA